MPSLRPPTPRARPRALGVAIGTLPVGPRNSISDVPGVRVGHATVWRDEPHVARTGVTAIVPDTIDQQFLRPMSAGTAVLNGAGEITGSLAINEWGRLETPVLLTNTMGVGVAYSAVVEAMVEHVPEVGALDVIIPVVGECDDSFLNDARAPSITTTVARAALDDATSDGWHGGAVGAGTGMTCFDCKGGIGSSSRVLDDGVTVGVLALANFGDLARLAVAGRLVGRELVVAGYGSRRVRPPAGSCIVVVATDAPLDTHQCARLARRAGLGLARTGSVAHHGSGEIFLAFSTTERSDRRDAATSLTVERRSDRALDALFEAAVDATEEAVLDSLFQAVTVVGRAGNESVALPVDDVLAML